VGKGRKMRLSESLRSSEESSYQKGMLTGDKEVEERHHLYEYSCGVAGHVNEADEKLNTSITEEEDQRNVLIVGGIQIFLPRSQAEASISVVGATTKGHPIETIKEEEEKEQTLSFSPVEGEEHPTKFLKIFSQEAKQEMTAVLESAIEEEANIIDLVDLYEELESLERRVIVQIKKIQ
jgi:hypothetical protein